MTRASLRQQGRHDELVPPHVIEAYGVPWWPVTRFKPAEVEYIGPWPDGGSGMCVRVFPAASIVESNQLAQTFALAVRAGHGSPPRDRGDSWEIATTRPCPKCKHGRGRWRDSRKKRTITCPRCDGSGRIQV